MSKKNTKCCPGDADFRNDPAKILKRLKEGNERFMKGEPIHPNQSEQRRKCMGANDYKQKPFAIVLSCADSRVPPELIFDTGLGDLFVVRVAGNIANIDSIASIEYAVAELGCKYILVLGHQHCGAVGAAIKGEDMGYNLNHLLVNIFPAVEKCSCKSSSKKDPYLEHVTIENTIHTKNQLTSRSKIIRDSKIEIHTGYYKFGPGKVDFNRPSMCEKKKC